MIAYVEGRVAEVTENGCVVVTPGGVGYEVFLPGHSVSRLPGAGEGAHFFVCTVVREDALELFGFETWDERQTFLVLTSINRVGPRTALAILTVFRPDDLRRLVLEEDVLALSRVSGIGKKTAQQIFLELKYKLKVDQGMVLPARGGDGEGGVESDAVAGLLNLGYEENEAVKVVRNILGKDPGLDVGGVLRAALKALAGGRG